MRESYLCALSCTLHCVLQFSISTLFHCLDGPCLLFLLGIGYKGFSLFFSFLLPWFLPTTSFSIIIMDRPIRYMCTPLLTSTLRFLVSDRPYRSILPTTHSLLPFYQPYFTPFLWKFCLLLFRFLLPSRRSPWVKYGLRCCSEL